VVVALISLALGAPGLAGSATRASEPKTDPAALWKAFPLRVAPTGVRTRASGQLSITAPQVFTPPAVIQPQDPSRTGWFLAVGVVLFVVAASGAAFLALRGPARQWSGAMRSAASHGALGVGVHGFARTGLAEQSYVLYLPGRLGWGDQVVERTGAPPSLGEVIFDDELGRTGQAYLVKDVSRSPLPGDRRRCAVLRPLERMARQ
jgi:hypothetical protein